MKKITFSLLVGIFAYTSLLAQQGPGGVGSDASNRFWFIADQLDLSDGVSVPAWDNLGGNTLDANSFNNDPTYSDNLINGHAAIQFGIAANAGLGIADNTDLNNGVPFWSQRTFSIVVRTGADVSTRQMIYEEGGGVRGLNMYIFNGNLYYGAWNLNDDDPTGAASPWGFTFVNTAIAANSDYILTYVYNGNATSTGTISCYLNGNLVGTLNGVGFLYPHNPAGIGNTESADTYIETNSSFNGDLPFDGAVAEFIMYNTRLSNSQRISLENYLSSKYSIGLGANDIYFQDIALNGDYDFNVVSINRQSNTDQHVSTNRGTGLISLNTSSTLSNGDYFSLGSDDKDQTLLGTPICNASNLDIARLETAWLVSKNGSVTPNIDFEFLIPDLNITSINEISILIDDNPGFSSPVVVNASSVSATSASFDGLNINDGDYITFEVSIDVASVFTLAGLNLSEQERFKFEANEVDQADGTNVSIWDNQGVNINNATTQNNSPSLLLSSENGQNMLQFDRANTESFEISNNSDLNEGGEPYSTRTFSMVFKTGADVNSRQVLYEEGGTTRGIVMYILNQRIYFGAYNQANDDVGSPWNFTSVTSGTITPNTTYVVTNIFSGNASTSGFLQSYVNGELFETTGVVGLLYDHAANISIGENGDGNIYESGPVSTASHFGGQIGEFVIYNTALNRVQVPILNNHLMAKYGVDPADNDFFAHDTPGNGNYDYNLIGVGQAGSTRVDQTTFGSGVLRLSNPTSLDSNDGILVASDLQDQTVFDRSTIDCSSTSADNVRLQAVWRADVRNTPGNVDIELDYGSLVIPTLLSSEIELIVDSDPAFSSPTRYSATDFCSSAVFENVALSNGQYFTFERVNIQPVVWNGTNYINGSGPSNTPTVLDEFKKLLITAPGASLGEDASCTCLVLDSGSDLDVAGFNVNVGNDVTNNGTITGDGEVLLNGTSAQTISGGGDFENLRLDNPTSVSIDNPLDTPINLNGVLYVDQGTLNTDDNLYLRCAFGIPPKTAQIGPVASGSNINGDVTVEQCYPARRAFRLLASSVTTSDPDPTLSTSIRDNWQEGVNNTGLNFSLDNQNPNTGYGTHITGSTTGADGFDATPSGNRSMFTFANFGLNRGWNEVTSTEVSLTAGEPYRLLIRGDRSINVTSNSATPTNTRLRSTGVLTTGPNSQSNLSEVAGSFNFIANPYHAQLDMRLVTTNSTNIRNTFYYVWDPTLAGSNGRGAYVTVDLSDGSTSFYDTSIPGLPSNTANEFLQPMQAAFVLVDTDGFASVDFEESHKDVTPAQTETKSLSQSEYINIQLFDANSFAQDNTPSDGLTIKFDKSYSSTSKDDAPKLGNLDENLARKVGSDYSSIELRPFPEEEERLELFINQYRREAYVMKFDLTDNLNTKVFIEDKYLNQTQEITTKNNTYAFTVNTSVPESEASDRFSLVFEPISLSTPEENISNLSLYPNPTQGNFRISGRDLEQGTELEIYNMIGQQVYKKSLSGQSSIEVTDFNANTGLYLVKLKTNQGERTFKLIKE